MTTINLIPMARIDARHRRRRVRGWVIACGGYLCVLVAAWLIGQAAWGRTDPAADDEAARLDQRIDQADRRLADLHPELTEAHLDLQAGRAVAVQPDWSILLALLSETRGDSIVLERCALSPVPPSTAPASRNAPTASDQPPRPTDFRLEISGLGVSQDDVLRFAQRLEDLGLFHRVQSPETHRRPFGPGHAVVFQLECRIRQTQGQSP